MRIAMVSDAIYPYHKGGKETRLHELSTRLVAGGHEVDIYTMKWWSGPELDRMEEGVKLHAISRLWPLYAGERRSVAQGVFFGVACFRLLKAKFDVVDVDHMPYFPLFSMRVVCWLKRRPMVATWHEVWGTRYWREYLGNAGLIAAMLERLSVYMPDRIVAVSPHTAQRLRSRLHTPRPVTVASNGIDADAIALLEPVLETSDITYVGRLLEHKQVDLLIHAVALLKPEQPDIRCTIISDGPERANLEALARELGLEHNVIFKGFVSGDDEKLGLVKASRVFVLPSSREGFGLVALEALACGVPVVTVDHPDNAARLLVTPETGRVVAPNPSALAGGIRELLKQGVDRGQVQRAALAYDWDHSAHTLHEVYGQ